MATRDYRKMLEGFQPTAAAPLDTQGDYRAMLADFQPVAAPAPQVSPEVTEDLTAQPVGRPATGAPEAPAAPEGVEPMFEGLTEVQQKASEAADQLQLNPYVTGESYGTAIENVQTHSRDAALKTLSPEAITAGQEFIREEGLPVVGGLVGTMLAAPTGGTSLWLSMGLTAGGAGVGAGLGEGLEQTMKMEGLMDPAATETRPKDAWDVLERSAWRGGEEAAWSLVPDMLIRGTSQGFKNLLKYGATPAVDVTGKTLDMGRQSLQEVMQNYAEREGIDVEKLLLTSDVVESGLFNAAENVAANSYISGRVPEVRAAQAEAIKGEISEAVEQFMGPAQGYVSSTTDSAIARFIEPNMEGMNDFAVAGLVNVGFKKAQDAQKAVARSMYKTVGGLMEITEMKTVYKEVELPILGADGRPLTTMQVVQQESPSFPVFLDEVRAIGEERMDVLSRTGAKIDAQTASLLNFPAESDFAAVGERLIDMKADSRSLGKSTAEGAAKQKLVLDRAIAKIEAAMDDAAQRAEAAGVTTPDGRSVYELKKEADAVWKEQVEDFQNSYVMNIIKKTHPKNGAPEKLGKLFIQNETAARNIMKVLDDAKGTLEGEALEQVTQAENAIKGSIVEEIFMPFDNASGKYVAPDVSVLTNKEKEMRRMFGDEAYTELRKLGAAIEQQSGDNTSNYLGFAQRARESGMFMSTLKSLSQANLGPLIRDGSATVMFAMGAGKLLTDPRYIRMMRNIHDETLPIGVRTQIAQSLIHRTYEYQQAVEATLTPEERERMEATMDDRAEAARMRMDMVQGQ